MAKIIVIANGKGGTGKSTLCIHLANYLTAIGKAVAVLDADEGQTVMQLRTIEMKNNPDAEAPWPVWKATTNAQGFMNQAKQMGDCYVLVDCPGSVNQNLLPYFESADAIVIPFRYDDVVIMRTMDFVQILKVTNIRAKQLLLPNCIDVRIKNPNEEAIKDMFRRNGGYVLPRIKQGVAVQRCSTLRSIDDYQKKAIEFSVDGILNVVG
jgi:chromosome partitioning protein